MRNTLDGEVHLKEDTNLLLGDNNVNYSNSVLDQAVPAVNQTFSASQITVSETDTTTNCSFINPQKRSSVDTPKLAYKLPKMLDSMECADQVDDKIPKH